MLALLALHGASSRSDIYAYGTYGIMDKTILKDAFCKKFACIYDSLQVLE